MLGEFAVADGRCGWRHVGEEPEIDLVGGGGGAIATWCVELLPWLAAIAALDCVVAALELAIASSLTHSDGRLHTCENIFRSEWIFRSSVCDNRTDRNYFGL